MAIVKLSDADSTLKRFVDAEHVRGILRQVFQVSDAAIDILFRAARERGMSEVEFIRWWIQLSAHQAARLPIYH